MVFTVLGIINHMFGCASLILRESHFVFSTLGMHFVAATVFRSLGTETLFRQIP